MSLRVLVVDDDRDTADSLAVLLRSVGYDTREAYCGAEAVAISETFLPNAVIVDLMMPAMSGFDAVELIRPHLRPPTVLIAMSGLTQPDYRQRAERERMEFLLKPTDPAQLLGMLASLSERTGEVS